MRPEALEGGFAEVNANGMVTTPSTKITLIPFEANRLDNIRSAKQLILSAAFSTVNNGNQSIKVFADQEIDVRVGMKLKTQ